MTGPPPEIGRDAFQDLDFALAVLDVARDYLTARVSTGREATTLAEKIVLRAGLRDLWPVPESEKAAELREMISDAEYAIEGVMASLGDSANDASA